MTWVEFLYGERCGNTSCGHALTIASNPELVLIMFAKTENIIDNLTTVKAPRLVRKPCPMMAGDAPGSGDPVRGADERVPLGSKSCSSCC